MIEEYDLSWIRERVPDIDWLFEKFGAFFDAGAYVAGGSLRRAIRCGSIQRLFDPNKWWVKVSQDCSLTPADIIRQDMALTIRTNRYIDSINSDAPDIDFYVVKEEDSEAFIDIIHRTALKSSGFKQLRSSGYAQTFLYRNGDAWFPFQLVTKRDFIGDPISVLSTFDFVNCKVAITKNKVYVDSEFENYENKNCLKLSDNWTIQSNSSRSPSAIMHRINKYTYSFEDYTAFESASTLIEKILHTSKKYTPEFNSYYNGLLFIESFFKNRLLNKEDLLFLNGRFGVTISTIAQYVSDVEKISVPEPKTKEFYNVMPSSGFDSRKLITVDLSLVKRFLDVRY